MSDEVLRRVLDEDSRHVTETIVVHGFRWLGHVSPTPANRTSFHARAGHGWRKRCDSQADGLAQRYGAATFGFGLGGYFPCISLAGPPEMRTVVGYERRDGLKPNAVWPICKTRASQAERKIRNAHDENRKKTKRILPSITLSFYSSIV